MDNEIFERLLPMDGDIVRSAEGTDVAQPPDGDHSRHLPLRANAGVQLGQVGVGDRFRRDPMPERHDTGSLLK